MKSICAILRNMRITTQAGEQETKLCALIRVLQKCLKEEYSHNLVDIERLNGWLTNLVPCPQSLMIDTKLQRIVN